MTISRPAKLVALAIGIGASGVGCEADRTEPMTPAAGRVPRLTEEEAADSIAHMRCDRQERCDHIGPLETFGSFTQCIQQMHLEVGGEMGRACADGVTRASLRYCLGEIAAADCGISTAESYPACQPARLCR